MSKLTKPAELLPPAVSQELLYHPDAYAFVQSGLTRTIRRLGKDQKRAKDRHVTGQDLAKGLRDLAKRRWGLLARTVLERWGIRTTMDFGRIVYAMIDAGLMSKSDDDSVEDFRNVYDFKKAFAEPARHKALSR